MPITFTLSRASQESGLCIRNLQYAIADGRLRSVRVGRRRLIPARALEEFLLGRPEPRSITQRRTGGESRHTGADKRALSSKVRS